MQANPIDKRFIMKQLQWTQATFLVLALLVTELSHDLFPKLHYSVTQNLEISHVFLHNMAIHVGYESWSQNRRKPKYC